MCEDPHGPGGDPDRAGTANWAASQIPLDDSGRHTRRRRPGPAGHNTRRRGPFGGFLMVAVLASLLCPNGDDGNGDPAAPLRDVDPSKAPPPTFRLMTWLRQSTTSDGGNLLRQGRPVAWFRWTFLDLDRHAQDCQWVRFLRALGYRRTAA